MAGRDRSRRRHRFWRGGRRLKFSHALLEPQWLLLSLVLFWCALCGLLALLSGWARLASEFRTAEPAAGESFRFVSGALGMRALPVRYDNCLFVTVNERGLRLAMLFLFRLFSPPLFIPWRAVASVEVRRVLFLRYTRVRLRDHWPIVSIRGAAGRSIEAAFARAGGAAL